MTDLIVFLVLLALGYSFGRLAEIRHYKSIRKREKQLRDILVIASRFPPHQTPPPHSVLVTGSVVVSIDYFKRFLFLLRNVFGGRVKSYESLLDRARREAILRMKTQAHAKKAAMIFNVKLETASISKGRKQTVGSIEVLAYGTALIPE
ncbi:MAG: YbjQ family protein [Gammaproteobacteria bacterium]|nr:YbjQ family protein [Gammaproteobacteria bacterium]